jgi:hypothetical protein
MRPVPVPGEVERLASMLLGPDCAVAPLPAAQGDGVLAALERALLPALERSPCVVSFSGGRDSSAILAVAADVARRHGLPAPVPVTMRFPGRPESDESSWQRVVLDHLGLRAEVVDLREELDALGPIAVDALRRNGVRWPANAYLHAPVLELARGGALVTGVGGDELLGAQASRHVWLLRARSRPRRSDPRTVARDLRPRRAREAAWLRAGGPRYAWLTDAGQELVDHALARDEVSWPHRWDRALDHWYASRAFGALAGGIALYATPFGAEVVNPLLDAGVLAELRRAGGATGFPNRTVAMRRLFGALLPDAVLARATKAAFTRSLFGPVVRAFARDWDGSGVDPRWVDAGVLRAAWLTEGEPDFRSTLLLHDAWLRAQPGSAASS